MSQLTNVYQWSPEKHKNKVSTFTIKEIKSGGKLAEVIFTFTDFFNTLDLFALICTVTVMSTISSVMVNRANPLKILTSAEKLINSNHR